MNWVGLNYIGVVDFVGAGRLSGWARMSAVRRICLVGPHLPEMIEVSFEVFIRADLASDAVGFRVALPAGFDISDLITERVSLVLFGALDEPAGKIRIWKALASAVFIGSLKVSELKIAADWLERNKREHVVELTNLLAGGVNVNSNISKDRSAIRADGGEYYLYRGNNDLLGLYQNRNISESLLNDWLSALIRRSEASRDLGCSYFQVFIPEKSSFDRRSLPYDGEIPSLMYREVISRAKALVGLNGALLDFGDVASELGCVPSAVYRRTDSHFSSYGAELFSRLFLRRLGLSKLNLCPSSLFYKELMGDLAAKFEPVPKAGEPVQLWKALSVDGVALPEPKVLKSFDTKGGNTGSLRIFNNPTAPVKLKIVVFGNSFFERGNNSTSISWWFARLFSEFHFIWSPEMDLDYISKVRPDAVLCQSIERFMNKVPAS